MKKLRVALRLSVLAWGMVCFTSCDTTIYRSAVPSMPVYMNINILAEYPNFVLGNGYQVLTFPERRFDTEAVGYAGLIVCVGMDAQYHAYDMACPVCLDRKQPVEVDGIFATCPICGERYEIAYGIGNPSKGIADESLRVYNTSFNGTNLIITQK